MGKYVHLLVVAVVVLVVVVVVMSDAQNRNNNGNRRVRQRGRNRQRGGGNSGSSDSSSSSSSRPQRPPRPARPGRTPRPGRTARPARPNRRRGGNRNRRIHPSCEEIYLPMCKGLIPYTHTKLPNRFGHTTQGEVYRVLEHKWAHMDHSCSRNLRHMVCSLYLPKCHGRGRAIGPCRRTCMAAKRKCSRVLGEMMGLDWDTTYSCQNLTNRRCLRPVNPDTDTPCPHAYPTCVANNALSVCANLTFHRGTVPNMFQQCDLHDMNTEIQYYDALRATNCHDHINFLLCGVYSPFCVREDMPFTFPCRELCEEVRTSCEPDYRRLYHNLPWPNKLQCHRYPSTQTEGYNCVMPNEGVTYSGGK